MPLGTVYHFLFIMYVFCLHLCYIRIIFDCKYELRIMPLLLDNWCSNEQEENNQTDTMSSDMFKFFIQAMETSPNEYNVLSLNYT